ncbi:MAG: hypothetical protein AB4058_08130 [Microcystaceae cyanobacterium]
MDLGLNAFYTVGTLHATSLHGNAVENPKYLRKSEKRLKKLQTKITNSLLQILESKAPLWGFTPDRGLGIFGYAIKSKI